ncbi:MAG TPA: ABC transporter permease [Nocardioides sp.]|uniref:Osmoprotectant transport system permease protein n=1 Tax=Nocardioides daedukensis TaxID=634462 RepID=A0A7Y9RYQ1_9ACTN|nr:ABC transporter permease [Nocardioides daedukensis]NYG57197.1 osmoprotectant transport system permease protein [Nocardioides daedukensis]
MAELTTAPVEDVPGEKRSARVITREMVLMLTVPPILVAAVFGGFVWWRQTAELDTVEANQLRWSELRSLMWEHVQLTVVAAIIVVLIAVPLGIMLTRPAFRLAVPFVIAIANAGQAAPSVGLIVLLFLWLDGGFWTAIWALSLYGLLPVLRNTIVGIEGIDPTLVEAGRGIGMTNSMTLFKIELPLAVPVIMAGVRTSLVLIAGTASLACFINAGGLGEILQTGISLFRFSLMVTGAVLIALLALLIEWLGRVLELVTRPKGI